MNVCVILNCAIVAVARQRAPIWLQRYEKTIKPAPFSVVIDVFSVSYQRPHYSSLIAQRLLANSFSLPCLLRFVARPLPAVGRFANSP